MGRDEAEKDMTTAVDPLKEKVEEEEEDDDDDEDGDDGKAREDGPEGRGEASQARDTPERSCASGAWPAS
ncbi:hypothetical protein CDD83_11081 [Cordyceps sp. RAO-2017]|nr:hypothetical protein CDD83_11081 [Cordyceps sp. RAO-2017]